MNTRISKLFLVASMILLVLSGFLLSVPGGYWEWFVIVGACAVVPAVAGPKWYRLAGIVLVAISAVLIDSDLKAGVEYRKKFDQRRARWAASAATNGTTTATTNRSNTVVPATNSTSTETGSSR